MERISFYEKNVRETPPSVAVTQGSEAVTESRGNAMIDLGQLAQEPPSAAMDEPKSDQAETVDLSSTPPEKGKSADVVRNHSAKPAPEGSNPENDPLRLIKAAALRMSIGFRRIHVGQQQKQ